MPVNMTAHVVCDGSGCANATFCFAVDDGPTCLSDSVERVRAGKWCETYTHKEQWETAVEEGK